MATILDLPKDVIRHLIFNYLYGQEVRTLDHSHSCKLSERQIDMIVTCKTIYNSFSDKERNELRRRSHIGLYFIRKLYRREREIYCKNCGVLKRHHYARIAKGEKCLYKYTPLSRKNFELKYYICLGCVQLVNQKNREKHKNICPKLLRKCRYCNSSHSYSGRVSHVDISFPTHSEDFCELNPYKEYYVKKYTKPQTYTQRIIEYFKSYFQD